MLRGIDRFLATILVVIFFIVVLAVVLVWRSPSATELEYADGSSPGNVVHNYVAAVTRGDEERAKSYLSPKVLENVEESEKEHGYSLIPIYRSRSNAGVRIVVEEEEIADGLATVRITLTRYFSRPTPLGLLGIFEADHYSSQFEVRLRQIDGAWKIVEPFELYMLH